MPAATPKRRASRSHKHFRLDSGKLKRAQRLLKAPTETEAIERALDFVLSEHQKNNLTIRANERFANSRARIKDVYGTLEP